MRNIIKLAIIVGILLQLGGHPVESKVVGWDYCIRDGHQFLYKGYKFGFPIPVVIVGQIWGCTTIPNQWVEYSWPGLIGTTIFWITVFWILESYWPTNKCAHCGTKLSKHKDGLICFNCYSLYPDYVGV